MGSHALKLVPSTPQRDETRGELKSVVLIGSYPPRRCGIATFTRDVHRSLTSARPDLRCDVFAMTDQGGPYDYPPEVALEISHQRLTDYQVAAARLSEMRPDVVFVQHEFGIFGGPAGEHLLRLLEATDRPVVSQLHTVLSRPSPDQWRVLARLIARSNRLIVMADRGRAILRQTWSVPDDKITVIPHGAPDRPLSEPEPFKEKLGFVGRDLLFSFGLLSPNKGIEHVIRALPAIAEVRPNVLYAVLGATHPHLIAREGERYRASLLDLARRLGVEGRLQLIDEYASTPRLIDYLQAADVYVSPYLNRAQITSGTLSYAAALGVPIVSTQYWHAEELLGGGAGRLVPFADQDAIAREAIDLLQNPGVRQDLRERLYARSRGTIWSCFAENALAVLTQARPTAVIGRATPSVDHRPPSVIGVRRLTDDCGIMQHSLFDIPDRRHGYCVDDNARALLLMNRLPGPSTDERRDLTQTYAAFVQHAWNGDRGRFRNFMSYERVWLEETGSEDSTGRTFWSVADTAKQASDRSLQRWAQSMSDQVLPHLESISAPRANAFILLGLSALIEAGIGGRVVLDLARSKLARLKRMLAAREAQGAPWFEAFLSYDNARLPEAMIRAGVTLDPEALEAGLRALSWLCARQTDDRGLFRPVATGEIGQPLAARALFDQQPIEAAATVDACEAAWQVTRDDAWIVECDRAYAWYHGANTLGLSIAQPAGECFDGLTLQGPNENMGAEFGPIPSVGDLYPQQACRGRGRDHEVGGATTQLGQGPGDRDSAHPAASRAWPCCRPSVPDRTRTTFAASHGYVPRPPHRLSRSGHGHARLSG